jgi:hypothetical protein
MIIVGCDFHPSWQQVMIFDSDTGEISERKLAGGPPLRFLQRWGPGMFDGHRLRRSVLLNSSVPTRLKRYYQTRHLHFITCSCYHRQTVVSQRRRTRPLSASSGTSATTLYCGGRVPGHAGAHSSADQ